MLMKASTQSLTEQLSARFAQRIRDRLLAPGTGGSDEGRDLTLWSCNDQGLTWASRQDCGARPSSMSATPPHSRGSR